MIHTSGFRSVFHVLQGKHTRPQGHVPPLLTDHQEGTELDWYTTQGTGSTTALELYTPWGSYLQSYSCPALKDLSIFSKFSNHRKTKCVLILDSIFFFLKKKRTTVECASFYITEEFNHMAYCLSIPYFNTKFLRFFSQWIRNAYIHKS